jgi:hypothetical protein
MNKKEFHKDVLTDFVEHLQSCEGDRPGEGSLWSDFGAELGLDLDPGRGREESAEDAVRDLLTIETEGFSELVRQALWWRTPQGEETAEDIAMSMANALSLPDVDQDEVTYAVADDLMETLSEMAQEDHAASLAEELGLMDEEDDC